MSAHLLERDFALARAFDRDGAAALTLGKRQRPLRRSVLPGFGLSLGYALLYLSLIVLLPLSAAFIKTTQLSWPAFVAAVTSPRVLASYRLTFGASLGAAVINAVFGLLVAWVLVRYRFVG